MLEITEQIWDVLEQNRIVELEGTYSDHPAQLQ